MDIKKLSPEKQQEIQKEMEKTESFFADNKKELDKFLNSLEEKNDTIGDAKPFMFYFGNNDIELLRTVVRKELDRSEQSQLYSKYGTNLDREHPSNKGLSDNGARLYALIYKIRRKLVEYTSNDSIKALETFIENRMEKCTGRPLELSRKELQSLLDYLYCPEFKELLIQVSTTDGAISINDEEIKAILGKAMVLDKKFANEVVNRIIAIAAHYDPDKEKKPRSKKKNES